MMSSACRQTRREFLALAGGLAAAAAVLPPALYAQAFAPLVVASAGSFRAMLEGPLKDAAAQALHLTLSSHSQGADSVAHALIDGSLTADLFVSITGSPLVMVMQAGKAHVAYPIARTELVLICSPKSRFAGQFELARQGHVKWWELLQSPGLRIARSNPTADPSGRAILFAIMLAAKKYNQPNLVEKVLGSPMNPVQMLSGSNKRALFQSGEIDIMAVYKTGPAGSGEAFLTLPNDVNLSRQNVRAENPELSLSIDGKTFYPEPLVFYAATLSNAPNPKGAAAFLALLTGDTGRNILESHQFYAPGDATPLRA